MVNPIPLLEELIEQDSSTKEGVIEIVNYCETWLKERGLSVERLENEGYPMLVSEIGSGDETVIFNAHVDVVEAEEEQFDAEKKDGKLYGRGAIDMKAGVAAMMETMVELKDKDLNVKVMLQIVPDEETGGRHGTKYLTDNGYLGDFIICGEPTNFGIAVQAKGVVQLDLTLHGEPAHGSRPWEGRNAITMATDLFYEIFKLPFAKESEPPMYEGPSINLAKISGGDAYNKVPKRCEMSLDIRYLPSQSPQEIIRQIEEITEGDIHVNDISDPVVTKEDNPFVQTLASSLTNVTSLEKAKIYGQHGSNDGKYFTPHGGYAIEFGPIGHDWHGDNEYVYMDSVKDYQEILSDFLLSLSREKEMKKQTAVK
ncbi:M20 family metallopeptidase [Alkalicoccus daliensis]|uniref:Succinyl-diaminopimelate desuccinylase n=1 Tax=Alkalicoccus daliensis TaxID=745820 RepID=A0A1H0E1Z9_9BACI|nr:M20/M25/M40 family metallo-hydrolase [Alkalicoccus daliensis]SDN76527.1 succinyl-diaminopimelate desuccinylase [Alkalicoccus daliensis]